jgi:hypothetical protein
MFKDSQSFPRDDKEWLSPKIILTWEEFGHRRIGECNPRQQESKEKNNQSNKLCLY